MLNNKRLWIIIILRDKKEAFNIPKERFSRSLNMFFLPKTPTRALRFIALFIPLSALLSVPSLAQPSAEDHTDAVRISASYVANYDSLLNSYYLRSHREQLSRHNHAVSVDDFDQIPDSVIARRLAALHTVIPMTYNSSVRAYIRMYLNMMSTRLDVMLSLSDYYHPMFEEVLSRYGVPEELKYLAIVESAMNPLATSRVGAAGLWQFMYHTGKLYDMEVNSVVDDRRDPHRSTVAAARYLRDLRDIFDDWTLAIAAYNCGPGNINKAIVRSGGHRNFWLIYPYLPRETRGYIPAFIAATYVMNYYPEHGLRAHRFTLPIHSDTLRLRSDALFCFVSRYTGVTLDELRTLNPQYRADLIPASSGSYTLCLPTDKIGLMIRYEDSVYARTADSLTVAPVEIESYQPRSTSHRSRGGATHLVRKGETLSSIARKHGTTVAALRKKNHLRSDKIRVGQRLKL
ncbi:MAG: membrane-bound lytic murein transglycosylase D [bacterium P3]|nr:MAG: membrane-bound lytic murein transglycosylase D [bacterium P3]KWW42761.1 MAG: membrane-bound lytic murein transglycosylase D [bacterium F083]